MNQQEKIVNTEQGGVNQRFRGEWILASFLIVIISLQASYFLMNSLNKIGLFFSDKILILFVIFIVIILSAFYTYMRKMPAIFLLKVSGVSVVVLLILAVSFLGPLISSEPAGEPAFWLVKLDYEPEYYVEITPEELDDLPTLQGLNNKSRYGWNTELVTTKDERDRIIDMLTQKKLEQDYPFEMWVRTAAFGMDEIPTLPVYIEISEKELELFPSIKKAVIEPDRWYGISLDEWDSFLEFTEGFHDRNGIYIKSGEQLYKTQTMNTENIRSFIQNSWSYIKVEGEYYRFRIGGVG